jgi:peptidoglycan/LPS O-acetylase OafA/YrhL
MAVKGDRIPSLDGLRAISIIAVLVSHASFTLNFPHLWWPIDAVLGVRIFFVISGFLITWLMLKEESTTGKMSLPAFYRRRFFRILPVFWCYLIVICLLLYLHVLSFAPIQIIQSLTFTVGFWKQFPHWVLEHTWSLTVEEHFYLLWPTTFVFLPTPVKRLSAVTIALVTGPLIRAWIYVHPHSSSWMMWTILGNGDMIGWGCFAAIMMHYHPDRMLKILKWHPALVRLAAIVAIHFAQSYCTRVIGSFSFALSDGVWMSIQAAAIAYLIISLKEVKAGILYRLLNLPLFVRIGVLSYSLYIWQQLFLYGSGKFGWQHWPLNIICVCSVSVISFYCIERPFLRLRRRKQPLSLGTVPMLDQGGDDIGDVTGGVGTA